MKAQKLMAQYHISMVDIEAMNSINSEDIVEDHIDVGTGNKWKYSLARVIANNFRCRTYCLGKWGIVFYGYKTDVEIAKMTFTTLFEVGNKAANKYYNQIRKKEMERYGWFDGRGIKNSFLVGYVSGIKSVLEKQCTELMIVTPKEVNEAYEEKTKDFKKIKRKALNTASYYGKESYDHGYQTGRNTVSQRELAMC